MKQKLADFFNLVFGFRKFIAWLAVFLIGVIFRIKDMVDGGQFVDLMKSTFLAFVAANGAEHLLTTVKEYIGKKGIPTSVIPVPSVPNDDLVPVDAPTPQSPATGK